jgi:4-amino-4-deoxy-L-arabinose transferase-like glycosyltransferase
LSLHRKLLLLALAGLLVRAAFLLLEPATSLIADEKVWTNWAIKDLVTGKVRFSPLRAGLIFYPPAYPYFIALFHELFGTLTAVKWAQVVVSALLVPAVGRVGVLVFGERAGLVAASVTAFYPDLVWFSVHFWCEPLFLALLWWAFERLLSADARASTRLALAAGVLWGLATLTRETGLYFAPLAALWLAWRPAAPGGPRRAAAFLLAAALTVAPWTYRNWVVHRAFVPVGTAGGLALYQGNSGLTRDEVYERYGAIEGRIEQYRWARRMGIQAILDRQPTWIFEKLREEMPRFWEADSLALVHIARGWYGDVGTAAAVLAWAVLELPYLALLAFFVAGLAASLPDRRGWLLLGFLCFHNLLHVATHGFARYRLPVMPVLFVVAAWAWVEWRAGRYPALSRRRRALAAGLAFAFAFSLGPSLRGRLSERGLGFGDPQDAARDEAR